MSGAAEACSWLLAAELARRCGPRYQMRETHPGGGQYDCLSFIPAGDGARVDLNRVGRIHVHQGGSARVVGDEKTWQALAQGSVGVRAMAHQVAVEAGWYQPRQALGTAPVVAAIAVSVRSAALFGVPWRVQSGSLDSSGAAGGGVRRDLFRPYEEQLEGGLERALAVPERYWFLVSYPDQHPVACFDQHGWLMQPGQEREELATVTEAQQAAGDVVGPLVSGWIRAQQASTPRGSALGLPAVLSAFNRKERYFLHAAATGGLGHAEVHGASVSLSEEFAGAVTSTLGESWRPPGHAWACTDFHLDWLHAGLQWWSGGTGPGRVDGLPTAPPLPWLDGVTAPPSAITGTQEDADLLVCWHDGDVPRVLVVEAKAYGAWSNKQATAKYRRLQVILDSVPPGTVAVRWLLTSPTAPSKLDTTAWREWALVDGKPAWMALPVPPMRVAPRRCDADGKASAAGTQWRLSGPTASR